MLTTRSDNTDGYDNDDTMSMAMTMMMTIMDMGAEEDDDAPDKLGYANDADHYGGDKRIEHINDHK